MAACVRKGHGDYNKLQKYNYSVVNSNSFIASEESFIKLFCQCASMNETSDE